MTTLADLQNRIIQEMNRDDLADTLASSLNQKIADAIEDYGNERFWFNESSVVTQALSGQQYTPLPSAYDFIDELYVQVGGVQFRMRQETNEYIQNLYTIPQIGQPLIWCPYQTSARLWPTPNTQYPLTWLTVSDITPALTYPTTVPDPTLPAQQNTWTSDNAAAWLICARTKQLLYRDVFKDYDAAKAAEVEVMEAYSNVKGITNRRLSTGRMRAGF